MPRCKLGTLFYTAEPIFGVTFELVQNYSLTGIINGWAVRMLTTSLPSLWDLLSNVVTNALKS